MIDQHFKLKDFDGPLDLLLALIDQAKIDIRDIFISDITDQYIHMVRSAGDLDMDEASSFLVMAATLLEIKSRNMLPVKKTEETEEDPETELIRKLEEYKFFKQTAQAMIEYEKAALDRIPKLPEEVLLPPQEYELTGMTLERLAEAFRSAWMRKPPEDPNPETNHYASRNIHRDVHTVQECMLDLLHTVRKKRKTDFDEIVSKAPTREAVVTFFLAMLELIRLGQMKLRQDATYGKIELYAPRKKDG